MPKNKHFVIVTSARTGSNLLYTMLHSHPDIYCEGEIFNHKDIREKFSPWFVYLMRKLPYWYIRYRIRVCTKKKPVYGFKLFPKQLDQHFEKTMKQLANKNVKFIYLERKIKVSQIISFLVAEQQNKWSVHSNNEYSHNAMTLNLDKLGFVAEYFAEEWQRISMVRKEFPGLTLVYEEDLLWPEQQENLSHKLAVYLLLPHHKLNVSLLKTDLRTDEERITNLEEILYQLAQLGYHEDVQAYKQYSMKFANKPYGN